MTAVLALSDSLPYFFARSSILYVVRPVRIDRLCGSTLHGQGNGGSQVCQLTATLQNVHGASSTPCLDEFHQDLLNLKRNSSFDMQLQASY